jgi:hypothetical protein
MSRLEVMLRDFMCYIRIFLHEVNKTNRGNEQISKHNALPFFKVCTNSSIPYTNGCPAQLSMIKPKTYMLV